MKPNQTFDVAVVGGGIIGLSVAWRAQQRRLSVAVVDAGSLASESSKAGAGMLAPGGEAHRLAPWAKDTVEALRLYPAFVDELRRESGLAIDFRLCGAIDVASTDAAWAALQSRRTIQQQLGISLEEIPEPTARRMVPWLRPGDLRALCYPGDAVVDPRTVTAALLRLLARDQATLLGNTPILSIERDPAGYRLRHPQGEIHATAVVLAAGAWASTIALPASPDPRSPSETPPPRTAIPIRGHLARCLRDPGILGPIVREGHLYVFQRNTGELITGSNEEQVGFLRTLNPDAVRDILLRTERLLPGLFPPACASDAWLGFRPGIEGDGPEVRRLAPDRIWLAYGHYRNGILLAPHTAATIAREIAG